MLKAIWQLLKYLINIMGLNKLLTIFITLFKLPWQINYSFVLNFFANINPNDIINIFACVATLSIAVIIFIAEIIRDGNNDALDKKLYLSTTKLKSYIIQFILIIYLLILLKLFNMPFILLIITLILLIMYIYQTYNILKKAINLLMQKDYYNKSLDNYVLNSVKDIIYKDIVDLNEKEKFLKFINNQNIITIENVDNKDYIAITANKAGLVEKYDINILKKIVDKYTISFTANNEKLNNKIIILKNLIGEDININTIIAYVKKGYVKELENDIGNIIVYNKNREYINDKINLINSNYFHKYLHYDNINGYENDDCQKILDYIKYLYQENLTLVRNNCFIYLETEAKSINELSQVIKYSYFLIKISYLSYKFDKLNEYIKINEILYGMFVKLIQNDNSKLNDICYNFVHLIFQNASILIKNDNELYYESNLEYLLKFIIYLMKNNKGYEIKIALSNIRVPFKRLRTIETLNKYEILNFQFVFTMIHGLILYLKKYEDINTMVKEIINLIEKQFEIEHNAWLVVENFKKYYNNNTNITRYNNSLELYFEEFDYLNNEHYFYGLDPTTATIEYLYIFKVYYTFDSKIDKKAIEANDRFYYQDILSSLNNKSTFYDIIENNRDYDNLKKMLEEAIKIATKKETDNIINLKIDLNQKDTLLNLIVENFNNNDLINYLTKCKKIKKSKDQLNNVYGVNELLERDVFLDNSETINYYSEDISNIIQKNVINIYINEINKKATISNKSLIDTLNSLDNIDDYILITSYISNPLLFNYKIKILEINNVDESYLIKKSDLPMFKYCHYSDDFNKNFIKDSWYNEVIDLSKDEIKRTEIIKNNDWLKEKGDESSQDYYLKQLCQVKIFLAYKIEIVNKDMNVLKFIEN